ncbi:hypothetical protein [Bacillus alkalicellulosilyticus]|uniref:hypothetical protein n=1 Tax=Alkalihalobacterium alkalicellulosilyticum TaxID=1912214 RepID=UPI0009989A61|nr:hypothetical protein [Bacillus alkalicellulosilyticus]
MKKLKIKRTLQTVALATIATFALTGCGTADDSPYEQTTGNEPTQAEEEVIEEQPTNEETEKPEEAPTIVEGENEVTRLIDQVITFDIEGELHEESGFLRQNDNNTYSLYVLEGYDLVAEEPNKDVIIGPNDDMFARIEVAEGGNIETLKNTIKETALAVDKDAFINDTFHPTPFLEGAVWYKAYSGDVVVNYILITSKKHPIILTLQTPREGEYYHRLMAMVETIEFK